MSAISPYDCGSLVVAQQSHLLNALHLLERAHRYASATCGDPWDYAVDASELRSVGVFSCDLRWLIARGYLNHAAEMTPVGARRKFRRQSLATLDKNSCFVITAAGLEAIHAASFDVLPESRMSDGATVTKEALGANLPKEPGLPCADLVAPKWNPRLSELTVEGRLVKRFRRPASNQQTILERFQMSSWPERIEDPLPGSGEICPKRRLHEAIKALNRHQIEPLLRFSGDGSARGVLWRHEP